MMTNTSSATALATISWAGLVVRTRLGAAPAPDLVLTGTPPVILGLLSAHLTPSGAQHLGVQISADITVLRRIQPESADRTGLYPSMGPGRV